MRSDAHQVLRALRQVLISISQKCAQSTHLRSLNWNAHLTQYSVGTATPSRALYLHGAVVLQGEFGLKSRQSLLAETNTAWLILQAPL